MATKIGRFMADGQLPGSSSKLVGPGTGAAMAAQGSSGQLRAAALEEMLHFPCLPPRFLTSDVY
jgi:hypothetical protein